MSQRSIRWWMAADAVLVIIFMVLLVVRLSGDGGERTAGPTPTATVSVKGPTTPSGADASFRLPSGNIACTMSTAGVTCTIASVAYDPPAVAGCDGRTGHVLVLNEDGFSFACVQGPAPTVAGDDVPTLEYGSSAEVGGYTCRSATDGVRCTDADGVGFHLARAAWRELP
ncbi:DUF6636 domain-containing protein [Cellulomonas palmilytica]|uniref:DUF6636 domain-containing protein n=1 Tax=Cellulomonas palmilytica TaxID=2608402 RepID=UPI001F17C6B6|nr:DUF6636 domain-containing protein [Cellulomonas palmilytica]UJP38609.1 hypothetical protein F1D97_09220 [Cellulomonas palmilytica]